METKICEIHNKIKTLTYRNNGEKRYRCNKCEAEYKKNHMIKNPEYRANQKKSNEKWVNNNRKYLQERAKEYYHEVGKYKPRSLGQIRYKEWYRKSGKEKENSRKQTSQLTDGYIKQVIRKLDYRALAIAGIGAKDIPSELIEIQRESIQLHRQLKQLK